MKRFIVFSLFLISCIWKGYGCGPYYPYGDDIRFRLLKPGMFNYSDYTRFNYSASIYYDPEYSNDRITTADSIDENVLLWRKRCNNIPDLSDVYQAVYIAGANELNNRGSRNTFIRYLHRNNDKAALQYLHFAKRCSPYNSIIDDPWERNEHALLPARSKLMNEAVKLAASQNDPDLKKRYAFLAIRLAYYNSDKEFIVKTYSEYFNGEASNIIDYWAMYFMAIFEPDVVKRNYYCARVFLKAPDKRWAVFFDYDPSADPEKTCKLAENSGEKAAVWMMHGFRRTGKCLNILKEIYHLNPQLEGLSFLLQREINKLEDWIYTPYYTNFNPSLQSSYETDFSLNYPASRINNDRQYARELLQFVASADKAKVENPTLWRTAQAYLRMMVQDYETALKEISALRSGKKLPEELRDFLDVLNAVCVTANQEKPVIRDEIKPVLMKEFTKHNYKFIFAIARELEYKGNTTDAAALLSKLRERTDIHSYSYWQNGIYWKTGIPHHTLYVNYYSDYFFYLDAQYSTTQTETLIDDIKNNTGKDKFSLWKMSVLKKDLPRLYDLLGTKYLRKNDLETALSNYRKVNDTLWWSSQYYYSTYLDSNPFYTNFYNEHSKTDYDTAKYTKPQIVEKLIQYLHLAETNKNKSDYYYFLAANCYFNMTQYGNSWMMRRYFWSANAYRTMLDDDDEYFNCILAKQYYLKAKETTRSRKFAALCLRMAGRCEDYRLRYTAESNDKPNKYYHRLKKEYPGDYDELMSNCESFTQYFHARKT